MDSLEKRVEAYTRQEEGWLYRLWEEGEVEVPCLEARFPVSALYEGVGLPAPGQEGPRVLP